MWAGVSIEENWDWSREWLVDEILLILEAQRRPHRGGV